MFSQYSLKFIKLVILSQKMYFLITDYHKIKNYMIYYRIEAGKDNENEIKDSS